MDPIEQTRDDDPDGSDESIPQTGSGEPDFTSTDVSGLRTLIGLLNEMIPLASAAGSKIGRFELLEELGRGGFGLVWKAYDPALKQHRALKVPLPKVLSSPPMRRRFLNDAIAAAKLDHPNIVRTFEADECGGICYIVMELCQLGTLADWLAKLPADVSVPPKWAASLIAQVADGVQHAHSRGILHRDLKPGNILLVAEEKPLLWPEFRAKVCDFGLAKIVAEQGGIDRTASGTILGSLPYMAPEQARGDLAKIGFAADIYGIGTVLYELLTRHRPFAGEGQAELLNQILNADPTPPRKHRPDLPASLEMIVLKCLNKSPDDRYYNAAALADDLRLFVRDERPRVRPLPWWRKARIWAGRHPYRVAGGTTVAAVTLVAAIGIEKQLQGDADVWVQRLGAAQVADWPELIVQRRPDDARVSKGLRRLFDGENVVQKAVAATALAPIDARYGDHVGQSLLAAEPKELGPWTLALRDRLPVYLLDVLESVARSGPLSSEHASEQREAHDRRRTNAAIALILLGRPEPGWQLLNFAPNPQARSFLIHGLGPASVPPEAIYERLSAEPSAAVRMALVQCIGQVPKWAGREGLRSRIQAHVLGLYEHDPDPGVHGSAKWLMLHWGLGARLREINDRLSKSSAPPGQL